MIIKFSSYFDKIIRQLPEWIFASMMTNLGLLMYLEPHILESPVFDSLASVFSDKFCAIACITVGVGRIASLFFNTLLKNHWFTAKARTALICVSAVVWGQLSLGFILAGSNGNAGIGRVVYPYMLLLELINAYFAAKDSRGT